MESSDDGVGDGGGNDKASSEDLEVEQCVLDEQFVFDYKVTGT